VSTGRLDAIIWTLIYGGLALSAIGASLRAPEPGLATGVMIAGAVVTLAGVVLVWVRSRTVGRPPPAPSGPPADSSRPPA
jgi:hypothetical protein